MDLDHMARVRSRCQFSTLSVCILICNLLGELFLPSPHQLQEHLCDPLPSSLFSFSYLTIRSSMRLFWRIRSTFDIESVRKDRLSSGAYRDGRRIWRVLRSYYSFLMWRQDFKYYWFRNQHCCSNQPMQDYIWRIYSYFQSTISSIFQQFQANYWRFLYVWDFQS